MRHFQPVGYQPPTQALVTVTCLFVVVVVVLKTYRNILVKSVSPPEFEVAP